MMDVGPRMGGFRWFWPWALATPGGGSSGSCWSLLAASGVGAAPRHSWRRVPLVLLMVRVVDVMVLLMPMRPLRQPLGHVQGLTCTKGHEQPSMYM